MAMFAAMLWLSIVLAEEPCNIIETTIVGNSMQGILWDGQKITVYTPTCGKPERYDHMLFTHAETPNAIVKQIWGMPGDMLRVAANGRLYINDIEAKTPFGKPYVLVGFSRKRLKRLEGKPLEGFVLLGHPGSGDSGQYGLIPIESVLGHVKRAEPYAGPQPEDQK